MSDIITRFIKTDGRETRGEFWSVGWPYFIAYALVLAYGYATLTTPRLAIPYVLQAASLFCVACACIMSPHIIRRMHDAGVSGFFCWLMIVIQFLYVILGSVEQAVGGETLAFLTQLLVFAVLPVLHVALLVFCCLGSESGENAYGASAANPGTKFSGTSWGGIIEDMLKLMLAMGILGGACNLMMKPFETKNVSDSLVSLIRKGGIKDNSDPIFSSELSAGLAEYENFINTKDNTGRTPLMWAVYSNFNNPELAAKLDLTRVFYVKELLKVSDIDVRIKDRDGFSALHWAAWSGMPACALELLAAGLDINDQEGNGYTPLMLAAMRGNAGMVEVLLRLGADTTLRNKDGKTAAELACQSGVSYGKRDDWKYGLIFSKHRETEYSTTLALLQNPPAPASLDDLRIDSAQKVREAVEQATQQNISGGTVE